MQIEKDNEVKEKSYDEMLEDMKDIVTVSNTIIIPTPIVSKTSAGGIIKPDSVVDEETKNYNAAWSIWHTVLLGNRGDDKVEPINPGDKVWLNVRKSLPSTIIINGTNYISVEYYMVSAIQKQKK